MKQVECANKILSIEIQNAENFIKGLDARLDRGDELTEKFLKTSHAVRDFFSILIKSTLVKQAENDKKIEEIKAKIAEGFIAV